MSPNHLPAELISSPALDAGIWTCQWETFQSSWRNYGLEDRQESPGKPRKILKQRKRERKRERERERERERWKEDQWNIIARNEIIQRNWPIWRMSERRLKQTTTTGGHQSKLSTRIRIWRGANWNSTHNHLPTQSRKLMKTEPNWWKLMKAALPDFQFPRPNLRNWKRIRWCKRMGTKHWAGKNESNEYENSRMNKWCGSNPLPTQNRGCHVI